MFAAPLPAPKDLARLLTMRSFEIEGIEGEGDAAVIEADILPNRAHDCLGLRYVAREVAAVSGVPLKNEPEPALPAGAAPSVAVSVEDPRCRRYVMVEVSGVSVSESPAWLKEKIAAMGQRSISSVVDASNLVLFLENQPTHAFDADKVKGAIRVRASAEGERMTTLDGRDLALDPGTLVIADDEGPLAIAGVKGGNRSGVSASTTRVYLESANFDPVTVRKAGQRYDLRTDSSKRFEVEISPELAARGMARLLDTLREVAAGDGFAVSGALDHYPRRAHPYRTGVSASEASALLGRPVTLAEAKHALESLGCETRELANPAARIFEVAAEAVGKPYKYGASVLYDAPNAFDCSSLVAYAAAQAGLSAPRMSVDQYAWGRAVAEADLQPGDLVFSCIDGAGPSVHREPQKRTMEYAKGSPVPEPGIDHCGIYAGSGEVIHATERGGGLVKREPLATSEQFKAIVGYRRAAFADEPRLVVAPPAERLDLRAPEDLIEEIGRLGDLEALPATPLPEAPAATATGEFALARAVRAALVPLGFYEVMTSSFAAEGDLEVLKPANEEKPRLRTSLAQTFAGALAAAASQRHWLARPEIFAYEIGKVFLADGREERRIIYGAVGPKVKDFQVRAEAIRAKISAAGLPVPTEFSGEHIDVTSAGPATVAFAETALSGDMTALPLAPLPASHRFTPLSPYPYSARDVAVWVPGEGGEGRRVAEKIRAAAGPLLVKLYKFDEFTKRKEGEPVRTSYAFRLILQAADRTLSDAEIAAATDAAYAALRAEGWEIR
jgi:phenylalanyl-tRNA synthetase beta subunit